MDGQCAFDIYSKYLNIQNDKNFFDNVLEFPLLLERDENSIVRAPFLQMRMVALDSQPIYKSEKSFTSVTGTRLPLLKRRKQYKKICCAFHLRSYFCMPVFAAVS